MSWAPITPNHAIVRVRIIIFFAEPVTAKIAENLAENIDRRALGFGARTSVPANSIEIDSTGIPRVLERLTGWQFARDTEAGQTVEALTLNPQFLAYESAEYGRWSEFIERYQQITDEIRLEIKRTIDVKATALEYLDRFVFEGDPDAASPTLLIQRGIVKSLPESILSGQGLWHVHRGWFENVPPHRFLINQNIDAQPYKRADAPERRGIGILTKVEQRPHDGSLDISSFSDDIAHMHDVSNRVVREALIENMRIRVGLEQ